ncbi:MAG TPA: outer membrane beta-barrel protein [Chitinophagaceae bacterium]|nr:outer membrane beta-barrel protein [Chitinophagaceae bacterium]
MALLKTKGYTSGLKAGVNLYKFKTNAGMPGKTSEMRTNAHAGIFYRIPLGGIFHLQPEAIYSGEGVKTKGNKLDITTVLQYVTVPLMFQVSAPMGFYVETGSSFDVLVKGNETNKIME